MKRWLWIILPLIIAACGPASASPTVLPIPVNGQENTQAPGLSATGAFMLTAEMETVTAGYLDNESTSKKIMTSKSELGTAVEATMAAQPSETPLPALPTSAPFCQPTDLQRYFESNGAARQTLVSVGLKNTSAKACFLQSWPKVLLEDPQGRALNVDYSYMDIGLSVPGSTATEAANEAGTARVGLWPGWSVWANLVWQNWCAAPVNGGVVIQLTFKNSGVINIPTDIPSGGTCTAQGQRSSVGIAKLVLVPAP